MTTNNDFCDENEKKTNDYVKKSHNEQDLTEQWKKGELTGEYWCEITESPYPERVYLPTCDGDIIVKVLAPVPSYGDCLINEAMIKGLSKKVNKLIEENRKLKELLKECREVLKISMYGSLNELTASRHGASYLLPKINEVLK